jgi:DNA-3-methyladenine glycosylase
MSRLLPQSFYARDALVVAEALLGQHIHAGDVVLRITEVEAYRQGDSASHCRMGKTARNAPMWGPPGHAYVYLCYGMHHMLNIVTNREGQGAAVLIRACEPVAGLPLIERRRGSVRGPALLTGPGKVGAALALDTAHSGERLFGRGVLELREGSAPDAIVCGPRIGIDYATREHRQAPWRLAVADCAWVSKPSLLRAR